MKARAAVLALLLVSSLPATARAADDTVTVAVSYFDNTAGAPELDVLRKGIADMLISDLAPLPGVRVVEREKLEALLKEIQLGKGPWLDGRTAQKMGRGLGAQLVLTGSFLSLAPSLRIDARVVGVESGEVMATASAEGPAAEFFKVQGDLALRLSEALGAKVTVLGRARLSKARTRSLEALSAYSRALDAEDRGDGKSAREAFARALAADPEFERARERLAALEQRVGELEQRTSALEEAGGYVLKPRTPADFWANAQTAAQKSDAPRLIESFLGGLRAANAPGARLPLSLFLHTLAVASYGTSKDAEAHKPLEAIERAAFDASLPVERRALYALVAGGERSQAVLEALAPRDGFAAWMLGLHRDAALRAELTPVLAAGAGGASPGDKGAAQRRLLRATMLPVLPYLDSCSASPFTVANCLVPTPLAPSHQALLAWIELSRRHGKAMRAFAEGAAPTTFDDATVAVLRRHLAASLDLIELADARLGAHPAGGSALGEPPREAGAAKALVDGLAAAAAARPGETSPDGEPRPASLLAPGDCSAAPRSGWARLREVEGLSEADLGAEPERVVLWTPAKLCGAVDAAVRLEVSRRLLESQAFLGLADEGPRAEALSWLVLDALTVGLRLPRSGLELLALPLPSKVECPQVVARLSEVAAARVGTPPLERLARFAARNEAKCGLLPSREAAEALRGCRGGTEAACVQLALLHGKAIGRALPEARERGFWGEAGRTLRARCEGDRASCAELGQAWLSSGRAGEASDPARAAGAEVLTAACRAGAIESCVLLAIHHGLGRQLAPSAESATAALESALAAARRDCDAKRPCLLEVDAARRCAAGADEHCELLGWTRVVSSVVRGELSELRSNGARLRRELDALCKRGDGAACAVKDDRVAPLGVLLSFQAAAAVTAYNALEDALFRDVARRCDQGAPRACAVLGDQHALRAAHIADRTADLEAAAAQRRLAQARYQQALALWDKRCAAADAPECPRYLTLSRLCAGGAGEAAEACAQLVDELGRDTCFRRSVTNCREADAARCRVDSFQNFLRDDARGRQEKLASACGSPASSADAFACRLSKHITPAGLPHLPELARPVARRACQALRAPCASAAPPTWCAGSTYKELCPP